MKKIYSIICLLTFLCVFACTPDEVTIVTENTQTVDIPIKLNENRKVTFSCPGSGMIKYEVINTGEQDGNNITKISIDDKEIASIKDNELPKTGEKYVGKGTHKVTAVFGPVNIGSGMNVMAEGSIYISVME